MSHNEEDVNPEIHALRVCEPKLVASTATDLEHQPKQLSRSQQIDSSPLSPSNRASVESNYFSQAQWTADGTSVVTNSADQHIRTYIVPPDLLEDEKSPHHLQPYCSIPSIESVYATTLYPGFNLQVAASTLVLSSVREHPIRLNSALTSSLVASYSLVNENTEAYVCPNSLLFTQDGTRFMAGSDCLISVFDVSRPGSGPVSQYPTVSSKRRKSLGGGVGMKGIISAMDIEPYSSILAAGTYTGQVGLYAASGQGDTIGVFPLSGSKARLQIGGRGVTQLKWSPCGKYLYVAERMSDGVLVYDVRDTGQLLCWLKGRRAMTNQRMGVDLAPLSEGGHELWAGATDGTVRGWTNPHMQEGAVSHTFEWAAHNDAISSTVLHSTGSVVATCSGQRHFDLLTDDSDDSDQPDSDGTALDFAVDSSLKIWDLTTIPT